MMPKVWTFLNRRYAAAVGNPSKGRILMIYTLLTVATLMAFWQVTRCGFFLWDDGQYVTENPHIINGVTVGAVRWLFTHIYDHFYHPLAIISHMLDVQLFGLNPLGHHLTSLLFHIANTLLLFFIFHRMTKAPWKSAFVAALFALHPLHVESVAWVAERKDVLSTFFWMLTMGAYIHYVEHPRLKNYVAVLIFFVLGLMAKPMLVTLPFVLLLLDYWPLQRLGQKKAPLETRDKPLCPNGTQAKLEATPLSKAIATGAMSSDRKCERPAVYLLLIEKIPFFGLIPVFSLLAYIAEGKAVQHILWYIRISNALVSYVIYISKAIWPTNLAIFYPHPGSWRLWQAGGAALLLSAITAASMLTAKRLPYLTVGWLWYMGTLVPVIGIVQIGAFGMADRYTYIPLIGLFIVAAWGVPNLLKQWRYRRVTLLTLSTISIASCFVLTRIQTGYWRDSTTLFDHALKVTENNFIVYTSRGDDYYNHNMFRRAVEDFDRAIEINPAFSFAYTSRGRAYTSLGNPKKAIEDYNRAIEINPESAETLCNRGIAYSLLGDSRRATMDFDRAIEINTEYAAAYNNRGATYAKLGNHRQAISDYDRAIEIDPEYAAAYNNRGATYAKLGNHRQAISDYDRAIEIDPEYADAYNNRGATYGELGNLRQAISDYDRAIEINPKITG